MLHNAYYAHPAGSIPVEFPCNAYSQHVYSTRTYPAIRVESVQGRRWTARKRCLRQIWLTDWPTDWLNGWLIHHACIPLQCDCAKVIQRILLMFLSSLSLGKHRSVGSLSNTTALVHIIGKLHFVSMCWLWACMRAQLKRQNEQMAQNLLRNKIQVDQAHNTRSTMIVLTLCSLL